MSIGPNDGFAGDFYTKNYGKPSWFVSMKDLQRIRHFDLLPGTPAELRALNSIFITQLNDAIASERHSFPCAPQYPAFPIE